MGWIEYRTLMEDLVKNEKHLSTKEVLKGIEEIESMRFDVWNAYDRKQRKYQTLKHIYRYHKVIEVV